MSKPTTSELNKAWANLEATALNKAQRPDSNPASQSKQEGLYSAEGLLEDGLKVLSERGKQYDPAGKAERSMEKIVKAFAVITGKHLTEAEGWMFMATLKAVRSFQRPGFHADSAQDFVCYSALYGEAKAKEGGPQGETLFKPREEALKGLGYEELRKNPVTTPSTKPEAAIQSYMAQHLSEEARNELRCKAYSSYKEAATQLNLPHAVSWHDMHPTEQKAWLSRVLGTSDIGAALPIIDPAQRKKDPSSKLDCPTCD